MRARGARSLWFAVGVVLLGGFVALTFASSAFFYWAARPGLSDTARLLLIYAPFALGLLHAVVAGVLVWRSSLRAAVGMRTTVRITAVLYFLLQLGILSVVLLAGSGVAV